MKCGNYLVEWVSSLYVGLNNVPLDINRIIVIYMPYDVWEDLEPLLHFFSLYKVSRTKYRFGCLSWICNLHYVKVELESRFPIIRVFLLVSNSYGLFLVAKNEGLLSFIDENCRISVYVF